MVLRLHEYTNISYITRLGKSKTPQIKCTSFSVVSRGPQIWNETVIQMSFVCFHKDLKAAVTLKMLNSEYPKQLGTSKLVILL